MFELTEYRGMTFASEQEFKTAFLKDKKRFGGWKTFQIETEETVPGFPDAIVVCSLSYYLYEFKYADSKNVIAFTKAQPLFYKQNSTLCMAIIAWDTPRKRAVWITPKEVVEKGSLNFKIPEKL